MYNLVLCFSIFISFNVFAEQKKQVNWPEQMQKLKQTLANAYPFFFSKTEFVQKSNQPIIEKALVEFRNSIHEVPVKDGMSLLGSEPLIIGAVERMDKTISEAQKALAAGDYSASQSFVKLAVNKCVACHTTNTLGPKYENFNKEMVNLKLPIMDRVIGLVAIREFSGALQIIDDALSADAHRAEANELSRTYLLISLRALNDNAKSIKFLNSLIQNKSVTSENKILYTSWINSIKSKTKISASPENDFVQNLKLSLALHKSLTKRLAKNEKAQGFYNLGETYRKLEFEFLLDLPRLYFQACVDMLPEKNILEKCQASYQAVMPQVK